MNKKEDVLLACTVGDLIWLKRSMSTGIELDKFVSPEGLPCLHLTAKSGHLDCMRYLLDNFEVDVNHVTELNGNSALHYCITAQFNSKRYLCLKLLVERGANHFIKNKFGQTVLHIASKCGDIKCLKYILQQGGDINTTDKYGHTPLKYASLHGHHECARLLQALHWAQRKKETIDEQLQENTRKIKQKQEMKLQEEQFKLEKADYAYKSWLKMNSHSNTMARPPQSCKQRLEARKQSRLLTCVTCTKDIGKKKIADHHSKPIIMNPKQLKRNTKGIGKPDKMHKYSNDCIARTGISLSTCKSGNTSCRSSRNVSGRSSRMTRHSRPTSVDIKIAVENLSGEGGDYSLDKQSQTLKEELVSKNADQLLPTNGSDSTGKTFTFGPEEADSDEDDSLFHDVGYANNLETLALPSAITKGKTPVEMLQLLRHLSNPSSRSYKRSYSLSSSKSQFNRAHFQRRFSLGSIPEGRIVTNYDEDMPTADSQLLDSNFLEELILSFTGDTNSKTLHSEGDNSYQTSETKDDYSGTTSGENCTVYSVESEESLSTESSLGASTDEENLSQSDVNMETQRIVVPKPLDCCVSPSNSLKIVNFAWNSETNMVESRIVVSPLSIPDRSHVTSPHTLKCPQTSTPTKTCSNTHPSLSASNKPIPPTAEGISEDTCRFHMHPIVVRKKTAIHGSTVSSSLSGSSLLTVSAFDSVQDEKFNTFEHTNPLASKSTLLSTPTPELTKSVKPPRVKSAPLKLTVIPMS